MTPVTALPQVDASALPPEVRKGSDEDRSLYRAALGFERMLVAELLRTSFEKADGEDAETAGAAGDPYRDLVPQTLADALAARGGVGLAPDLYRALQAGSR